MTITLCISQPAHKCPNGFLIQLISVRVELFISRRGQFIPTTKCSFVSFSCNIFEVYDKSEDGQIATEQFSGDQLYGRVNCVCDSLI